MAFMTSPNDPIFWIHHTNMDRYSLVWQRENPNVVFDGPFTSSRDQLVPFSVTAGDAWRIPSARYCYAYSGSIRPIMNARKRDIDSSQCGSLSVPAKIPETYIQHMHMNESVVRNVEAIMEKATEAANKKENYISASLLVKCSKSTAFQPTDMTWRFEKMTLGRALVLS